MCLFMRLSLVRNFLLTGEVHLLNDIMQYGVKLYSRCLVAQELGCSDKSYICAVKVNESQI